MTPDDRLAALPARLRAAARDDATVRHELARYVRGAVPLGYALGRVAEHLGHLETLALAHGPGRSGWPAQLCQWRWPDGTRCLGAGAALAAYPRGGWAWACEDCRARLPT